MSTPASTPLAATLLLWLVGLAFAVMFALAWSRRGWTPMWLPVTLVIGSVALPVLAWAFAAVSCAL